MLKAGERLTPLQLARAIGGLAMGGMLFTAFSYGRMARV